MHPTQCIMIFHLLSSALTIAACHTTAAAKSLQSCPTLCDPTDGSPPGSPIPGILQARTPEWVAIAFSVTQLDPNSHRVIQSEKTALPKVLFVSGNKDSTLHFLEIK